MSRYTTIPILIRGFPYSLGLYSDGAIETVDFDVHDDRPLTPLSKETLDLFEAQREKFRREVFKPVFMLGDIELPEVKP